MKKQLPKRILRKHNIESVINYDGFVVFRNNNKKYGVLKVEENFWGFKNYKVIIEPKYINIYCRTIKNDTAFIVYREDNMCALLDIEAKLILDFKYINISPFTKDQKSHIRDTQNRLLSLDYQTRTIEKLPFDQILRPQSNTYGAPTGVNCYNYKSIMNSIETKIDFYDNDLTEYIGKWGIIDSSFKTIISNKYDYIDFLRNQNHFKVAIGNPEFDNEGEYLILKNMKWGVIDTNEETILPIEYDWVEEINTNIYAVNKEGEVFFNDEYQVDMWTAKKGKWGVFNTKKNELIVPIIYDNIFLEFYQAKNCITVQIKGKEPELYTFLGDKIERKN